MKRDLSCRHPTPPNFPGIQDMLSKKRKHLGVKSFMLEVTHVCFRSINAGKSLNRNEDQASFSYEVIQHREQDEPEQEVRFGPVK